MSLEMNKEDKMKNYFDLTGQTAVVTGASTGLGVQMAKAFASQGANLVLIARRQNLLEENDSGSRGSEKALESKTWCTGGRRMEDEE